MTTIIFSLLNNLKLCPELFQRMAVTETVVEKELQCFHCGSDFDSIIVNYQEHKFCCEGCKNVYQILDQNNLNEYYSIAYRPGSKQNPNNLSQLDYLDDVTVEDRLVDFKDEEKTRLSFYIPGIHCASCIWLLENMQKINPAILQSEVNFTKKTLTVIYKNKEITLKQLTILLHNIGYEPEITLDSLSNKKQKNQVDRQFIYKLGVAGFCFGNIMLFSFPEYFHLDDIIDPGFRSFFGYLNLLLSLPVLLFSAKGYFISAFHGLKNKFINIDVPLALGILVMFGRSAYEIISGEGAGFMDALAGLVFFLLIGKWFQNKTYGALSFDRDFKSYLPISISRFNNNKTESVTLDKLAVGDKIIIRNGELIPADGILLKGAAWIDYSFVTGESQPVEKISGDKIYAGGKQTSGSIQVEIIKPVSQSYLSELWNQEIFTKKQSVNISARVSLISKYFTLTVLVISLITGIYWGIFNPSKVFDSVTAILIITCPCALALTLPFTFGNALRILNRNHVYLKNSLSIELLSQIDTIVFDKTGTLTDTNTQHVEFIGSQPGLEDMIAFKILFSSSNHPLSKIISKYIQLEAPNYLMNVTQIPGMGVKGKYKGKEYCAGSDLFINHQTRNNHDKEFTSSTVHISIDNQYMGYFKISNEYRDGIYEMANQLNKDYDLHVLSGDNDSETKNLQNLLGNQCQLVFNQTPLNKLEYIKQLQQAGKRVLMVGDGLNDSGGLKQANVGIAVTEDSANFFPASDGMMHANSLRKLHNILKLSKICMGVMKASFFISLLYNIIGLSFAVRGELLPVIAAIIMPLSSITVISFTVFTSGILAKKNQL